MNKDVVPVTKPYLPSRDKYKGYIDRIYEAGWLTNRGPLVSELEARLAKFLGVKNVIVVANGSLALQVAYKALNLKGEVITTPFSFAATASTIMWEGLTPIYADIKDDSFNINPERIEDLITDSTSAIVPVHVFGNPCEIDIVKSIADKHNLKVIYDAAHAFGVQYKGQSVLKYGDISTLSFHATKLFHSIEGGAIITENDEVAEKVRNLINFGITGPDTIEGLGTNAKMNEFEAAMGLCVLDDVHNIIDRRKAIISLYKEKLNLPSIKFQTWHDQSLNLGAYMPVLFDNEELLLEVKSRLDNLGILTRRYFYPSLDMVEALNSLNIQCDVSRDISKRILCLPIYHDLEDEKLAEIVSIMNLDD
ncbi:DegT/DnrJ/EryC1/StrS family aminotransferase [Vibrio jasicida]|uniref:DegT/DnrJ/EryC1/StrS family aminotransferase n=1 Tax=Vibrio jasicida TaxID=766224 RepID=UPI0005F0BCC3|nr:DegT/DnrJ/EryC1/StrS family aminotransferase [Vibrio jasicida]